MLTVQNQPISTRRAIAFPGTVSLWIYRDLDLLREEARQHAAEREGDSDLGDDMLAVFQPDEYRVVVDDEERVTEPPDEFAGILRIHHEASPEVISHECAHAALAITLRQYGSIRHHMTIEDEERFCHTLSDLVIKTTYAIEDFNTTLDR